MTAPARTLQGSIPSKPSDCGNARYRDVNAAGVQMAARRKRKRFLRKIEVWTFDFFRSRETTTCHGEPFAAVFGGNLSSKKAPKAVRMSSESVGNSRPNISKDRPFHSDPESHNALETDVSSANVRSLDLQYSSDLE
mmetsp:Transcript_37769/g.150603  ORF Transcript_37769/g.150603 Transcript_37769/m.150603 type:complete len:137 (-) Transcript_37769:1286-1696(-)